MHRHRRVAPQPAALRGTVKQAHGVTTSAVSEERKPPDILGEGTITRASGGPQGQQGQHDRSRVVCRVCLWWIPSTAHWTQYIRVPPAGCSHGGGRRAGGVTRSRCS